MAKPNYISEINMFYDWLETNQIPKSAIALWHGLMHIANKAGWEKSFTVAISTIESKTGFKRSELFEARNILTQKGRVAWKQRGGNLCAVYEINFFCVHNTDAKAYASADTSADAKAYTKPTQKHTINKTRLDYSLSSEKISEEPIKSKNPKKEKTEILHWKKLVETWFSYYKNQFLIEPTFNGVAAKNLKEIIHRLEKMPRPQEKEWTEEYCIRVFSKFLEKANTDSWLQKNFLLTNLCNQFDKIATPKNNGNNTSLTNAGSTKKTTGGSIEDLQALKHRYPVETQPNFDTTRAAGDHEREEWAEAVIIE